MLTSKVQTRLTNSDLTAWTTFERHSRSRLSAEWHHRADLRVCPSTYRDSAPCEHVDRNPSFEWCSRL